MQLNWLLRCPNVLRTRFQFGSIRRQHHKGSLLFLFEIFYKSFYYLLFCINFRKKLLIKKIAIKYIYSCFVDCIFHSLIQIFVLFSSTRNEFRLVCEMRNKILYKKKKYQYKSEVYLMKFITCICCYFAFFLLLLKFKLIIQ